MEIKNKNNAKRCSFFCVYYFLTLIGLLICAFKKAALLRVLRANSPVI